MAGTPEKTRDERFIDAFLSAWEVLDRSEKEPSDLKIDGYRTAMESFTIEQIETAFSRAMVECVWFPMPKELLELIHGSRQEIEDIGQVEACKVLEAVKRIGGYQSVRFSDPVTTAVIQQGFGGWVQLSNDLGTKGNDEKWFIKDFAAMYSAFRRQGRAVHGHLSGRFEIENTANGRLEFLPEPKLVDGDVQPLLPDSSTIGSEKWKKTKE
jgi:hypothetical protein